MTSSFPRISIFRELFFPDPLPTGSVVSWERAIVQVADLPQVVLARLADRFLGPVREHPDAQIRTTFACTRASHPEQCARAIMLGAVLDHALVAPVCPSGSVHGYELIPHVWRGAAGFVCSPLALACSGVYAPTVGLLPASSLSAQLSGAPIFVNSDQLAAIVAAHRRVSKAELSKQFKSLIDNLREGRTKFSKQDFINRLQQQTGASERRLLEFWKTLPSEFKYLGRPTH